ncbi:MAG: methyltransferase domain-containing protein [Chloroflexi bacterium]|nr:methyltransferase domain-containing protein [Chloroflexota bacterium]
MSGPGGHGEGHAPLRFKLTLRRGPMTTHVPKLSLADLRVEIKKEYTNVALDPNKGYHFHTGRRLANILGYDEKLYAGLPESNIASFAGTGNPFAVGPINPGETVVDVGSGAGFDSLIAARLVGPTGRVIGFDMTDEMLKKARAGAAAMGATNVEFREGLAESLPLPDNFADVVISNGVLNLMLDKTATLTEWFRVLKPGGRLQVGDILVERAVPAEALDDISLWTG